MSEYVFVRSMIGRVFKLLPMYEDEMSGREVFRDRYLESLCFELKGAMSTFPTLGTNASYISVVNTIEHLAQEVLPFTVYRREVLKAHSELIALLEKVGDPNV